MNSNDELAKQIFELPEIETPSIFQRRVTEQYSVKLEHPETEGYKLLSCLRSDAPKSSQPKRLEGLLKKSYDEHMASNMILSISPSGEYSAAIPYFEGFKSRSSLETDLDLMLSILEETIDSEEIETLGIHEKNHDWVQV